MKTKAELLSVLKMSEQEQAKWLACCQYINSSAIFGHHNATKRKVDDSYIFLDGIGSLAFGLRGLAVKKDRNTYALAMMSVFYSLRGKYALYETFNQEWKEWGTFDIKPIEIIIAALLVLDCGE
jgi:hypothetical protein